MDAEARRGAQDAFACPREGGRLAHHSDPPWYVFLPFRNRPERLTDLRFTLYMPSGLVETDMARGMGGISVQESVEGILKVALSVKEEDHNKFYDNTGAELDY